MQKIVNEYVDSTKLGLVCGGIALLAMILLPFGIIGAFIFGLIISPIIRWLITDTIKNIEEKFDIIEK